jgi:hypothetical protein
MNRFVSRLLALIATTQVGVATGAMTSQGAVTPDEEAWQRTVATNTLEAYARFSLDFPGSQHALGARSRLTAPPTADLKPEIYQIADPQDADAPDFIPNSIMIAY